MNDYINIVIYVISVADSILEIIGFWSCCRVSIDIVGEDGKIKVLIITGPEESSFCTGADIRYKVNIDPIVAERYATFIHALINKIENLENVVIAAVNGYALGGVCELY